MVKNVLSFLEQVNKGKSQTLQLVSLLKQADLIEPWQLNIQLKEQEKDLGQQQLQGVYRINEHKLKTLQGKQLEKLAATGALSLAYSQLLSSHRLGRLEKLYDLHRQLLKAQIPEQEINLDQVFGEGDEDIFKF